MEPLTKTSKMSEIATFVVMDLETTGLPSPGTKSRITEIAMHSVSRDSLASATREENRLPRVVNKMLFCVNPGEEIDPVAATLTGLNKTNLQHEQKFDKSLCESIRLFLGRLPQPVCLVAHNGFWFDFPILQAELSEIDEILQEDLLCVDSLDVFRELHPKGSEKGSNTLSNHKLEELFKFLVGSDGQMKNAHSADGDVEALMKCMAADGNAFVASAESGAIKFSQVLMK